MIIFGKLPSKIHKHTHNSFSRKLAVYSRIHHVHCRVKIRDLKTKFKAANSLFFIYTIYIYDARLFFFFWKMLSIQT